MGDFTLDLILFSGFIIMYHVVASLPSSDMMESSKVLYKLVKSLTQHPGRGVVDRQPYRLGPGTHPYQRYSANDAEFRKMTRLTLPQFHELATLIAPEVIKPRNVHGLYSEEINEARRFRPCKLSVYDRLMSFLLRLTQQDTLWKQQIDNQWSKSSACDDFHHVAQCIIKVGTHFFMNVSCVTRIGRL